jgi:hypothetical protein
VLGLDPFSFLIAGCLLWFEPLCVSASLTDALHDDSTERWSTAAREALMIYQRGPLKVRGVPSDFVWRLLEYLTYVLPLLIRITDTSGMISMHLAGKCRLEPDPVISYLWRRMPIWHEDDSRGLEIVCKCEVGSTSSAVVGNCHPTWNEPGFQPYKFPECCHSKD